MLSIQLIIRGDMKQALFGRIKAIEVNMLPPEHKEPVTFVDKESGLTMEVIGNGLVIPLPMAEKEWQAMIENQAKQLP